MVHNYRVAIISDYISVAIHELAHCTIYYIVSGNHCKCYLNYPWFLFNLSTSLPSYNISIYNLQLIISSRGPYSVIIPRHRNKLSGPLTELLSLFLIYYITEIRLLVIVIIVNAISDLYPVLCNCNYMIPTLNDSLQAINLFYPQFKSFNNNLLVTTIVIGCYLLYWLRGSYP